MGTDEYAKALTQAERELELVTAQMELFEQRRAQLEQTISALKTLMNVAQDEERTLTESIKTVIKAANGYISGTEIMKGAISMGAKFGGKNPIATLVTILGRLHKDGYVDRDSESRYCWKRSLSIEELKDLSNRLLAINKALAPRNDVHTAREADKLKEQAARSLYDKTPPAPKKV